MRVTVRNIGVLKEEATIDLKPLTIFIGPNNSGKTWLAYTLAGVLGPYGSEMYAQAYIEKQVPHIYEPVNQAIKLVLKKGSATIDLRKLAEEYGEKYFNEVAKYAQTWMHRFFSTQLAQFNDMHISLNLSKTEEHFLKQISEYFQRSSVAKSLLTLRKKRGDNKLFVYTSTEVRDAEESEEKFDEKIPIEEVRERLINFVSTAFRRALYPEIRIFPTERTTLVASRFSRSISSREVSKINEQAIEALIENLEKLINELDIVPPIEQRRVSREAIWPIGSFITMLINLFEYGSKEREERDKDAKNVKEIGKYVKLAEILEEQILAGGVNFSTLEPDPMREVLFQPTHDVNIEIPIASSIVKELSPLVLYLRYLARPGELLIIDEPEMNLHPAAQVKLIEFLAMLVNAGLHVLITTHSTYVVDHLVNLMEAAKHEDQDEIVEKFLLESKDAFISQEKVSAYLIDDGKVENILDDEGSIHWQTFSDVTKLIERIHFEL